MDTAEQKPQERPTIAAKLRARFPNLCAHCQARSWCPEIPAEEIYEEDKTNEN